MVTQDSDRNSCYVSCPDPVGPSRNGILGLRSEAEVAELRPNEAILNQINLDPGGIAVTARNSLRSYIASDFDIASRSESDHEAISK